MAYKDVKKGLDKAERDLTKERNDRCIPVAQEIIKMVAGFNGPMLPEDRMAYVKAWDPLINDIVMLLQEKGIPIAEWGYIMQIVQVPFDHAKNWVGETIVKNMDEVLDNYWGKESKEVTFSDIALKKREMVKLN